MKSSIHAGGWVAVWIVFGAVLGACEKPGTTAPESNVARESSTTAVIGGVTLSATTRVTRVAPTFPASLTSWVIARNETAERRSIRVPAECQVALRVYAGSEPVGRPVWDARGLERCAPATAIELDLLPGDSVAMYFETREEEILGDSLPRGHYSLAVSVQTLDGESAQLPTLTADLNAPPLREIEVPNGGETLVPGTDLRIALVEVTRDDRCTGIGPDGGPISCFSAGSVSLVLRFSEPGFGSSTVTLETMAGPLFEFGSHVIQYWGLSPATIPEDPADYVLTLRVSG